MRSCSAPVAVLALVAALAGCDRLDGSAVDRAAATTSWQLNTWVRSGGGSMDSPNLIGQTSTSGSVFRTQTLSGSFTVSVTASAGYQIAAVTVNGTVVASSGSTWSAALPVTGSSQSVWVTFVAIRYGLTASAGPGGRVSPTTVSNLVLGNTASATFTPIYAGWYLKSLAVTGASAVTCNGASCAGPWAAGASVKITATVAGDVAVTGTFDGPPVALSTAPQTVPPGALVTLDGRPSLGAPTLYTWEASGTPPAAVALSASGALATFVAPPTEGRYAFRLTVQPGGSSTTTTVDITTDPVGVASTTCNGCHAAVGIGSASGVFAKWSASQHAERYVMCWGCHVGANSGGHPGDVGPSTVDPDTFTWQFTTRGYPAGSSFCAACHASAPQIAADFQASIHASGAAGTPGVCSGCHGDPHAAIAGATACVGCHVVGGAVAGHPFAVDGFARCTTCHNPHTAVAVAHGAGWMDPGSAGFHAASANAGLAQCQGCHGATLDGGRTVPGCATCHGDGWRTRCTMCHGDTATATGAPPRTTWGHRADALRVGAHGRHLAGSANAPPIACGSCHVVPADALSAGHVDGGTAEVAFSGLAVLGASPAWSRSTGTCTNTYCHDRGGASPAPRWTGGALACDGCHAAPPLETSHRNWHWGLPCATCHPGYTFTTAAPGTHLNGRTDVANPRDGTPWTAGWTDCGPCHTY